MSGTFYELLDRREDAKGDLFEDPVIYEKQKNDDKQTSDQIDQDKLCQRELMFRYFCIGNKQPCAKEKQRDEGSGDQQGAK